jgi:superfamily II DNA or RNA helicase
MFRMSQKENQDGFQYRKGQEETINMILNGGAGTYLAVLPGGYGKTLTAIGAYYELRKKRQCDRFLYVAPSSVKLFEFNHDLKKQCAKIGFDFICNSGDAAISINDAFAIKEHQYNKSEFFMVTPQFGINSRGSILHTLLSTGNWFVCVDESHHYTNVNKFGNLISSLKAKYYLGLSATPNNTNQLSIFKQIPVENIYELDLKQGIDEEAIRRIKYIAGDYYVDLLIDGNVINLTTEQLREEIILNDYKDINEFEIKKQLRYLSKYVSPLFIEAIDKYDELISIDTDNYINLNRKKPDRPIHQILIFADTVSVAQNYCKMINDIRPNFANWIGTGDNGRKSKDNEKILLDYKNGLLPCLVQVSIAGEGFDNPQSSIIIYLSLQYNGNQVVQKIMRAMRRNYMIEMYDNDFGYVYVPTDSKALDTIKKLSDLTWQGTEFTGDDDIIKPTDEDNGWNDLPTCEYNLFNHITDVLFKEWQKNYLPEKTFLRLQDSLETDKRVIIDKNNLEHTDIVKEHIAKIFEQTAIIHKEELTRTELLSRIDKLIGSMAYKIVKNSMSKFINTTIIGDLKKSINGRYVYERRTTTKDMTFDQLKDKLQWLNDLSNNINESKTIPIWLQK